MFEFLNQIIDSLIATLDTLINVALSMIDIIMSTCGTIIAIILAFARNHQLLLFILLVMGFITIIVYIQVNGAYSADLLSLRNRMRRYL